MEDLSGKQRKDADEMTCKYNITNAATKILVLICIFTITLYVYGSIQLRWLRFPSDEYLSNDVFDKELHQQLDKIYHKHWNLFSGNASTASQTPTSIPVSQDKQQLGLTPSQLPQINRIGFLKTKAKVFVSTTHITSTEESVTTGFTIVYDETTKVDDEQTRENYTVTTGNPYYDAEITNSHIAISKSSPPKRRKSKPPKIMPEHDIKNSEVLETDTESSNTLVQIFNPEIKTRKEMREKVGRVFKRRRSVLRKFCGPRNGWIWSDTMQMLAVPERNLTVCTVQKAGSTSWHKLVHDLKFPGQEWDGMRKQNWRDATELSEQTRNRLTRSKNVTRVITVRHPFARLVSAWNNKFQKDFVEQNGNKMLNTMPGLKEYVGKHQPDKDHTIAFEDLAQYVADVGLAEIDVHLKSIDELCSPCIFPYDYVIKAETAPEYSWFVTEKINATLKNFPRHLPTLEEPYLSSNPVTNADVRHASEARVISRLFRKVPRATTRVLMELYADDFAAFGYSFDVSTLEVGGYE